MKGGMIYYNSNQKKTFSLSTDQKEALWSEEGPPDRGVGGNDRRELGC